MNNLTIAPENTTPDLITELKPNEVFVFGSNLAGRHGKGAARTAMKWGAVYGQGEGLQGRTYAFPTEDETITPLPLNQILDGVDRLLECAEQHPDLHFLVTKVGCGLAGYSFDQIAPLFALCGADDAPDNLSLPLEFWSRILAMHALGVDMLES
jgi:hypothetical protein